MKAYLVTFTATTRVVVDSDKPLRDMDNAARLNIIDAAYEQILDNGISDYLCPENADVMEDIDCPAGRLYTDEQTIVEL